MCKLLTRITYPPTQSPQLVKLDPIRNAVIRSDCTGSKLAAKAGLGYFAVFLAAGSLILFAKEFSSDHTQGSSSNSAPGLR